MLTHTIGDYSERKEDKVSEKKILLGNEAIARGAYEAGVKVSAAYPGTPSTEVSEALVQYDEIYAEWAPNEKVATEVAIGASIAGVRSMCVMKHVGMNVAADPLYTAAYTGVRGGMVLVETIFNWPGVGQFAYESVLSVDFPSIIGVALLIALNYMVINTVVDILYGIIDPRVRCS
jgi:hypothetical protein